MWVTPARSAAWRRAGASDLSSLVAAARVASAVFGDRARRLDREHAVVLVEHQRHIAESAQRPVAQCLLVGDQQPDVVDHERAHDVTAAIARASSAAASTLR